MKTSRSAAVALCAAISGLCTGCPNGNPLGLGPTICDLAIDPVNNPLRIFTDGRLYTSDGVQTDGGVGDPTPDCYETSSWEGPYLEFNGGEHYEIQHGLGCHPTNITGYLSFSATGPTNVDADGGLGDGGDVTPLGGDSFGVVDVGNEYMVVGNHSCVDFYLRVTACGCDTPRDAGSN